MKKTWQQYAEDYQKTKQTALKIEAIKEYRVVVDRDLLGAKRAVEAYIESLPNHKSK